MLGGRGDPSAPSRVPAPWHVAVLLRGVRRDPGLGTGLGVPEMGLPPYEGRGFSPSHPAWHTAFHPGFERAGRNAVPCWVLPTNPPLAGDEMDAGLCPEPRASRASRHGRAQGSGVPMGEWLCVGAGIPAPAGASPSLCGWGWCSHPNLKLTWSRCGGEDGPKGMCCAGAGYGHRGMAPAWPRAVEMGAGERGPQVWRDFGG